MEQIVPVESINTTFLKIFKSTDSCGSNWIPNLRPVFEKTSNKSQIEGFTFLFVFNEVTCSTYEIKLVDSFRKNFCMMVIKTESAADNNSKIFLIIAIV